MTKFGILAAILLAASATLSAQVANPTATEHWPENGQQPQGHNIYGEPIYKITVIGRDIPAINYFHRSGWTRIGFAGTDLLPGAKGGADVNSLSGRTEIKAHFEGLIAANSFGVEYLTYVLWAISPEGRPVNLGEVLWSHGKASIDVTTNLQSFGLILTAEPYFAVTMPSDLVVMQNFVLPNKTTGVLETVNAHYSLLPRGAYSDTAGRHTVLHPITRNDRSPLELYEAVNAVQIADAAGAEQWAAQTMATAKLDLHNAQQMDIHQQDMKEEITFAREAVQIAEDARIMTIRDIRNHDAEVQREQEAAAEAQAQQQRAQAEAQAQLAQQQAQQAQQQEQAAQQQQQEAEAAAAHAHAEQLAAEQAAAQAAQQTAQLRDRLRDQLNQVLQTQETARGLIVNMSDVLFALNRYDLKTDAELKLAKISGILLTYPSLKLQVEGYTDNTGSPDYNQKLSEERANAVEAFLVSQGVAPDNITAQGYGEADPVADNSTSAGRAQNRRVELVISGASIGVQQQPGPAASTAQPPQQPGAPAIPRPAPPIGATPPPGAMPPQ